MAEAKFPPPKLGSGGSWVSGGTPFDPSFGVADIFSGRGPLEPQPQPTEMLKAAKTAEPKLLYHGTQADFATPSLEYAGVGEQSDVGGFGFHVTPNLDTATYYAKFGEGQGFVHKFHMPEGVKDGSLLLHMDRTFERQPASVKDAIRKIMQPVYEKYGLDMKQQLSGKYGSEIYGELGLSAQESSMSLAQHGILGTKYDWDGKPAYAIFNPSALVKHSDPTILK